MSLRVLIADDQALVRAGLRALIDAEDDHARATARQPTEVPHRGRASR